MEAKVGKREENKKNIIMKGVKVRKEGTEGLNEEVEEIVKVMGVKAKIEEMMRIGRKNREGREMV